MKAPLFSLFLLNLAAQAKTLHCTDIPGNVLDVYKRAYRYHRDMDRSIPNLDRLYALRLSYGYNESHLYALASNDETSELNGLEVYQDLMRLDNGRRLRGDRWSSLTSYHEIFDKQGNYTLQVGEFSTNKGTRTNGREWRRGDVVKRMDRTFSTDYGFLQMSADQSGRLRSTLNWMQQKAREFPKGTEEVLMFCDTELVMTEFVPGLFGKRRLSGVKVRKMLLDELHAIASCQASSGSAEGVSCFGKWVSLCPRYSVMLGVTAKPEYFSGGTRAMGTELCSEHFR